jgi:hypothetical protein
MANHRNRVIYQSEALFVSPDATGYHYTGVNSKVGQKAPEGTGKGSDLTVVKQLKRVQSANYGFTVNKQDVNQFGHASRLDSIVVEPPTVNLDFSYYLLDGYNERMLGLVTDGKTNTVSGMLDSVTSQAGQNFFILTVPESRDAVGGDKALGKTEKSVISLGNGYVTDYSIDVSVGAIPTANITVEGMNIKADQGTDKLDVPSVDMRDGSLISKSGGCTGLFSLPHSMSGYTGCGDVAALRPGDVVLDLNNAGLLSTQVSGKGNDPRIGSAHVQSVSLNLPLARTTLQRLGTIFGFSKVLDLPLTATMSVSATLSDLKTGNMVDLLCGCDFHNLKVKIYDPECVDCKQKDGDLALVYELRGARLESENFSSTIGDNKSVDLTFTAQIGGADDTVNGLFISGKEANTATHKGLPPAFTGGSYRP